MLRHKREGESNQDEAAASNPHRYDERRTVRGNGDKFLVFRVLLCTAILEWIVYFVWSRQADGIPASTKTRSGRKDTVGVWERRLPVASDLKPVAWKRVSEAPTKLSYPIFVTSLPKSGTTSIWKYFKCGGQLSSHNWIQQAWEPKPTLAGKCIRRNIEENRPPFHECGEYDVYTDTGYLVYDHDVGTDCYFPSVDGLDAIYNSYPNATFVNVVRRADDWYESLKAWSHSSLFVRLRLCNATGFPNGQSTRADFIAFYQSHTARIRQFCQDRPSLTYVEVQLESANTGQILQDATGIDASCWKDCKPEHRQCETDRTAAQS